MPIYEYVCNKCKNKFELMRPFSKASEDAACPKCQNKSKRILSRCYSFSTNASGVPQELSGNGGSCASCSSGSCSSCGGGG
jgi:putative FmdB family regulatory protein